MTTPTWQNTLKTSNSSYPDIQNAAERAADIGYGFMCWSDNIYKVTYRNLGVYISDTDFTIEDLATVSIPKRVIVVAGRSSAGLPMLESYKVAYTSKQEEAGAHYNKAIDMAEMDGITGPFICYDEHEHDEILRIAERLNNSK